MRRLMLTATLLLALASAWSQDRPAVNPEMANCMEIKDEATQTQAEFCGTYLPCKMVLSLQQSCSGAKRFLTRLQTSIGDGVKTLFGRRKEVTPDAVFDATLSDAAVRVGQSAQWKALADPVSAKTAKADDAVLKGKDGNTSWVYVGDTRSGLANGAGLMVTSAGDVTRGSFKDGKLEGAAEVASVDGQRKVGNYSGGNQTGYGLDLSADGTEYRGNWANGQRNGKTDYTSADGARFSGNYKDGAKVEGTLYRADGSKQESGSYKNGELQIGQRFDERGQFVADVNLPRDRFLAAQASSAKPATAPAAAPEAGSVAPSSGWSSASVRQAPNEALNRMSAGELFSRADELREAGDAAGAQAALRALVARFPEHELGQLAAKRMAEKWSAGGGKAAAKTAAAPAAGGGDASGRCKAALQALDAEQGKLQQRVRPQGAVPSMRFAMYLMQQYLGELDRSCAGAPEVATLRADMQKSYKATETACNQMATSPCTPSMN